MFFPRSMAVVGLSPDPNGTWLNQVYLQAPLDAGFEGPVYPVNLKGGSIGRHRVYARLQDLPGPVDYVVSCVPARQTPALLEDCLAAGVKVVQLYTAGFLEMGPGEGVELQQRLLEIAARGGMRLIGPNCMGVYCPRSGMSYSRDFPAEPGNVGALCQSGGNATYLVRCGAQRGLRFSKVISYGNACDVNEADILEYLARDPETGAIAAYIEGASDGRRLAEALSLAAGAKPVVVYKGGATRAGIRAAASHTGAMAGSRAAWDALLRQAGAVPADSVEEVTDMLVGLLQVKPRGLNACLVGVGGGAGVLATDEMERAGLRLPPLPAAVRARMEEIVPPIGGMLGNPIDAFPLTGAILRRQAAGAGMPAPAPGDRAWGDFMGLLNEWPGIDLAVFQFAFDIPPVPVDDWVAAAVAPALDALGLCRLPAAVVLHSVVTDAAWQASRRMQERCLAAGVGFFLSSGAAARAMGRVAGFVRT